jgi:surfeit locus 1 family protein
MLRGYSFRPRVWALALAAAACAAFIALGQWQTRRAAEKRAAGAKVERIVVYGEFLPERTILLDNKVRGGRAGYEVVAPLRLAEGIHVLVNRGWIAAPAHREQLPEVKTPPGRLRVEGVMLDRLPQPMRLSEKNPGKVRQRIGLKEFAVETGLTLQAFVIEQHSALDDGLVRDWPRPESGAAMHESYAFQWYAFALLAVALAVFLSFRRVSPP